MLGSTFCTLPKYTLPMRESCWVLETKCSAKIPSSRTPIWILSSLWRTTMTRSTDSRRARNSASVMTVRRRPESRESRRRCFFASKRVEPRRLVTRFDSLELGSAGVRGARTRVMVLGGSSSVPPLNSKSASPRRRRRRRREVTPSSALSSLSSCASAASCVSAVSPTLASEPRVRRLRPRLRPRRSPSDSPVSRSSLSGALSRTTAAETLWLRSGARNRAEMPAAGGRNGESLAGAAAVSRSSRVSSSSAGAVSVVPLAVSSTVASLAGVSLAVGSTMVSLAGVTVVFLAPDLRRLLLALGAVASTPSGAREESAAASMAMSLWTGADWAASDWAASDWAGTDCAGADPAGAAALRLTRRAVRFTAGAVSASSDTVTSAAGTTVVAAVLVTGAFATRDRLAGALATVAWESSAARLNSPCTPRSLCSAAGAATAEVAVTGEVARRRVARFTAVTDSAVGSG